MDIIRNLFQDNKYIINDILSRIIIGKENENALNNKKVSIIQDDDFVPNDSYSDDFLVRVNRLSDRINLPWSLRFIYFYLGSTERQFYFNEFIWLSISQIENKISLLEKINQRYIADIAVKYEGFNQYNILSINRLNGKFFIRNGGGTNLLQKKNNWKFTIEFNPENFDNSFFYTFDDLLYNNNNLSFVSEI